MISNANFLIFDNNNIASLVPGLTVLSIKPSLPKRKLTIANLARSNKSKLNSAFYTERTISARVCIQSDNRDITETRIDSLMSYLQGQEKDLIIPQSNSSRKYIATMDDPTILKSGTSYWEAELQFVCSDSFGYDTSYTTILDLTGITASIRDDQFDFGGSADWQAPYFRVYFTSITGGTSKSVVIGNRETGQQITVTRTWASGDVLEIDSNDKSVKVNGVEVDFTGAFPMFAKGLGHVTYFDSFTNRTYNYRAYFYKRYV